MLLKHIINSEKREYYIKEVNAPLWKDIITLGKRYVEPTHDNVVHPNTHRLLDWRDEFYQVWDLPIGFKWVTEAIWKVVINKYEHSPNWRYLLDWVFMKAGATNWKPFDINRQMRCWKGERK